MDQSINKSGVALVIGSGGVKCAAALGILKVFERENIPLDLVVGCSGGSLFAAGIALGYPVDVLKEMTVKFWTPELMANYTSNLKAATEGTLKFNERSGLVDDQYIWQTLSMAFGGKTFADTQVPLRIVSTEFFSGEPFVHSSGSVVDAVRASLAVPVIFPPWEIDGQLLIDGAASDPLPVDVAIKEGVQVIVAMGFAIDTRPRLRSMTAVTNHLNTIFMNNILKAQYAFHNLAHHAEIVLILPDFDRRIGTFDTHHLEYIIEAGEQVAELEMPYIRKLLSESAG